MNKPTPKHINFTIVNAKYIARVWLYVLFTFQLGICMASKPANPNNRFHYYHTPIPLNYIRFCTLSGCVRNWKAFEEIVICHLKLKIHCLKNQLIRLDIIQNIFVLFTHQPTLYTFEVICLLLWKKVNWSKKSLPVLKKDTITHHYTVCKPYLHYYNN